MTSNISNDEATHLPMLTVVPLLASWDHYLTDLAGTGSMVRPVMIPLLA